MFFMKTMTSLRDSIWKHEININLKCAFYLFAFSRHATIVFPIKTFRKLLEFCKILLEQYFSTFGDSCAWLYEKKNRKPSLLTNSRHFEERCKTSLQCPTCGQRLEIVVIRNARKILRNALLLLVNSQSIFFTPIVISSRQFKQLK